MEASAYYLRPLPVATILWPQHPYILRSERPGGLALQCRQSTQINDSSLPYLVAT